MTIVFILVMFLNVFSFLGAGMWLAILGYWKIILLGLALSMAGTFVVSILLAPSMLLLAPILNSERLAHSKAVVVTIAALSILYTYCVMGIWAVAIFWYFAGGVTPNAAIPTVLWSYATSTGVWAYLAQKEGAAGNDFSPMSALFNQIGCLALVVYMLINFHDPNPYEMAIWFAVPMSIGLLVQVFLVMAMKQEGRV